MATYTGKKIKDTYESILKLEDNAELTGSTKKVTDGLGNQTPLSISTSEVVSSVNVEASGFKTPTGTSNEFLMADGSVSIGGSGDAFYEHDQSTSNNSWVVNHNLGKYPSATVIDTANSVVQGLVTYNSLNQLTITFNNPFSGKAYIN